MLKLKKCFSFYEHVVSLKPILYLNKSDMLEKYKKPFLVIQNEYDCRFSK